MTMSSDKVVNRDVTFFIKMTIPTVITVASIALGSVFWVQNYSETHFYDIQRGQILESQIDEIKNDVKTIQDQNWDIIITINRIEEKIEEKDVRD